MSGTSNTLNNYGNINLTVNNGRHPRDSESSIPSNEVKRRKKISYLLGNGQKEWLSTQQLLINGIDITRALKKFRQLSIKEAEKGAELNSLKILSLSHIFPINNIHSDNCITRYLPTEEAALLKTLGKQLEPIIPRSPADAILYCKDVVDGVVVEDDNEEIENEESMVKTVKELSKSTMSSNISANSPQASFSKTYVMPFIKKVILDGSRDNVVYDWIEKPKNDKKKPDIMIGAEQKKKSHYFFFVEIKKPSIYSNHQIEDSSIKLMREMKGSIDNQLKLGIKNPSSLGLLVEGFHCTLFRTTLLVDGVYAPIALKNISLVKDVYDLINLPAVVEAMSFVKVELEKFIEEITMHRSRGDREKMKKRICPSFSSGFCT